MSVLLGLSLATGAAAASTTVVGWGAGTTNLDTHPHYGQSLPPADLTNAWRIDAGNFQSFAIRADGSLSAWGWNAYNQLSVPSGLSDVVAVAPGWYHTVALKADGTVSSWGWGIYGETAVPEGLSNVVAVTAGDSFSLALRQDGTLTNWGLTFILPPAGLSNVVAIAAGQMHVLALKADGTVAIWGSNPFFAAPGWGVFDMPPGLQDIVAVAAGAFQSLLLKADGSVVTWGQYSGPDVPAGLTNVAAISTGGHNLALTRDGTVVAWGYDEYGQVSAPSGLSNVIGIAAGKVHSLALLGNGSPVMARQPVDRRVFRGQDTTFSAGAVGAAPLTYQWQLDGADVPGGTNALLPLANVQPSHAGGYRVVAGNAQGAVTSAVATLSVLLSPPSLQVQPASQFVAVGSNLTLTASAIGALPLRFQWQFEQADIPGATNLVLPLTAMALSAEGNYRVMVSNDFGQATGSNAFINVVDLPESLNATGLVWTTAGDVPWVPQFVNHHDGVAAAASGPIGPGQQSTLETVLSGPGTLSFWWSVSSASNDFLTVSVNGSPAAAISGGVAWQQRTVYLGLGPQNVRWTFARDSSGGAGSNLGWVDQVSFTPGTTPAGISLQPKSQTTWLRNPVSFSAAAAGTPPLRWQWQLNGADIPGATNAVFDVPSARFEDAGAYRVRVINDYGSDASSNAVLKVDMIAGWGENAYGQTNVPPGLTNIVGIATGGYHNLALKEDGTVASWGRNDFGQTNVPAGLSNVVEVAAGGMHSLALRVDGTVVAWGWNNSGQTNVPSGLTNAVAVTAGGNLSAAVDSGGGIWMWGYNNIGPVPAGASNAVAVAPAKAGYRAVALRGDGRIVLWPRPSPGYFIPDLSNVVSIAAGGGHLLALTGQGLVYSNRFFENSLTNLPGGSNATAIAAGSLHNLVLRADGTVAASGDNGSGQVRVPSRLTNAVAVAAGERVSLALVNDGSPFILRQPFSQWIWAGENASFAAAATSSEPLQYQWQYNGSDLAGATSSALLLTNVPVTSAGAYRCMLSNSLGTVVSRPAILTVTRPALRFENAPGSPALNPSGLSLRLNGLSGHGESVIYGSTDLAQWIPLLTNPPSAGSRQWTDPNATNLNFRFYRAEER